MKNLQTTVRPAAPWAECQIDSIPVSRLGFDSTLRVLRRWMGQDQPRRVATANLDFLRLAHGDALLRSTLQSADLVTADGWPLVALSRLTGQPVRERVAGSDLVPALLSLAEQDGRRVYFLGSTEGTMRIALRRIRSKHPRLQIAGHASPFIDWDDDQAAERVARQVRKADADLLLVALGCPRQDLFLARHMQHTGAALGVGIGGTLDFIAGRRVRAPWLLRLLGLEWLVRLSQEPTRLSSRYRADLVHLVRLFRAALRNGVGRADSVALRG